MAPTLPAAKKRMNQSSNMTNDTPSMSGMLANSHSRNSGWRSASDGR